MKRLLITVLFLAVLLISARTSYAVEFEPYFKYGTIDFREKGRASCRKAMLGAGVKAIFGHDERLKKALEAELWTMAEPVDGDTGTPHDGIALSGRFSYDFFPCADTTVYPFAGLGFQEWRRNSSEKAPEKFWGDISFADYFFGVGVEYKDIRFEAGVLSPFWTRTDSGQEPNGKLGPIFNIWIPFNKNIDIGFSYSQTKFGADGTQPAFDLELYSVLIGWRF